jgi:hypothetical protein
MREFIALACELENTMTQLENDHILELHTKAAYAHTAAAHEHSSGDHASPLDLARKALECSVEAVKYTEKIAKESVIPVALLEAHAAGAQPRKSRPAQLDR